MRRITPLVALLVLAAGARADSATPGRTDGPEGSEYGKGGYWHKAQYGRFYTEGFLGAAMVERTEVRFDRNSNEKTDLVLGGHAGYMIEEWLAFQLGFARVLDQGISIYSGGIRSSYVYQPFNYYVSLDAGLYSLPDAGNRFDKTLFGIAPGVGGEVMLSDHLRVALRFQRDFVFGEQEGFLDDIGIEESIRINRFTAQVQWSF